jgi:hypothetical protein
VIGVIRKGRQAIPNAFLLFINSEEKKLFLITQHSTIGGIKHSEDFINHQMR